MRERLQQWIDELEHRLPAQAPIRDFVHHNTLHGFQHLPFAEALAAAQALTGARAWWPRAQFLAAFAAGRISRDDLLAALADAGVDALAAEVLPGLTRAEVLLAALLAEPLPAAAATRAWRAGEYGADAVFADCRALTVSVSPPVDWRQLAVSRWQARCAGVGRQHSLRELLEALAGEDLFARVRSALQRHLAAHLDLGLAAWRNPECGSGFFAAWKSSAALDLAWDCLL